MTERPWHPGPTVLADLNGLQTPEEAPRTIRFPRDMAAMMEVLRRRSFPGGHATEQGATIVADREGRLSLQNIGGLGSTAGSFHPNYALRDQRRFEVVGSFHTHPYDRAEGWINGVSFSGADTAQLVEWDPVLSVVQSGPRLFVLVKTRRTPVIVDREALDRGVNFEIAARQRTGQTPQQASRVVAKERAEQHAMAYYQGSHGVATRV